MFNVTFQMVWLKLIALFYFDTYGYCQYMLRLRIVFRFIHITIYVYELYWQHKL